MARPRKYKTAAEFGNAIDEYFNICKQNNDTFPDEAGMIEFLGISPDTIERYKKAGSKTAPEDAEETDKSYAQHLARAKLRRESWLVRNMVSDNKRAQGCFNALKQAKNGGYVDRPQDGAQTGEVTIKVQIDGLSKTAN
jgi:hypothetical protein